MRDLAVQLAGIVAVAAAIVHQVLGETKVFVRARIEPEWARRLIRLVWLFGTIAWIGLAVLLVAAPELRLRRRAQLDHCHQHRHVWVRRHRQRLGDAGPPFWLDCADRRGRSCRNRAVSRRDAHAPCPCRLSLPPPKTLGQ